jgi:hypothetical protein
VQANRGGGGTVFRRHSDSGGQNNAGDFPEHFRGFPWLAENVIGVSFLNNPFSDHFGVTFKPGRPALGLRAIVRITILPNYGVQQGPTSMPSMVEQVRLHHTVYALSNVAWRIENFDPGSNEVIFGLKWVAQAFGGRHRSLPV